MNQETNKDTETVSQRKPSLSSKLPILLALVAIVAVLLLWLNERQENKKTVQTLASQLENLSEKNQQSLAYAKDADARSAEISARAGILEEKYTESFDQQAALKVLYQELINHREERMMSDVEQLLVIANQQLQLAGNVKPALLALQAADSRLQSFDSAKVVQLRKSINQDMQRLQNLPAADITGINLKLTSIAQGVDQLALTSDHRPNSGSGARGENISVSAWQTLAQEVWQDIKNMIRIERVDHPEPALLTPEQTFFLRENIKLHLLTARIALLKHDNASYKADLIAAEIAINRHFDIKHPLTANTLEEIKMLANTKVSDEMPDIDQSLRLINQYKLSFTQSNAAHNNKTKRLP